MSDFAVDGIGEIDRRGIFGKFDDITFRSEGEDMVLEELDLESLHEFLVVPSDFPLPFLELIDPGEFFRWSLSR